MLKRLSALLLTLFAVACGASHTPPVVSPGTTPAPPPQSTTTDMRAVGLVVVEDTDGRAVAGASCSLQDVPGWTSPVTSNAQGYLVWLQVTAGLSNTAVRCTTTGYEPYLASAVLHTHVDENLVPIALTSLHVDPSAIPFEQLAAIRGAMWPQGLGLPLGPRPNEANNIIATNFFHNYSTADQARVLAWENDQRYTHVVVGPLVDSDGYHGIYRPTDWREHWDEFLDIHQQFWDNKPSDESRSWGQAPVTFIHPDGWTFEQTRDALTPFLSTPRAQRLIRIAVVSGWEPTRYGWSSCTWAKFVAWGRQVLPNALILIHTVADVDAPVGTDELCDDNGRPNGEGWTRVVNAGLDGWLIQNGKDGGAYNESPTNDPEIARNFAAQFKADGDGATLHGVRWHFANGIEGWPRLTWRGKSPLIYNAECTSYTAFWESIAEAARVAWGNLAVASGADGYLDGGTVAVPVRR